VVAQTDFEQGIPPKISKPFSFLCFFPKLFILPGYARSRGECQATRVLASEWEAKLG
jgi:3-hydroxymyristoyl/3-hydroxydecanoyl-(acyl carrier protein) dehydratase